MLTLPLLQGGLTNVKVIQWTRTSTVACSCLLLLLLLLMMNNTSLCQACQLVACCPIASSALSPACCSSKSIHLKKITSVVVTIANTCCAIFQCHCHLPLLLPPVDCLWCLEKCICLFCHWLLLQLPLPSLQVDCYFFLQKRILFFGLFSLASRDKI